MKMAKLAYKLYGLTLVYPEQGRRGEIAIVENSSNII